RNFQGERLIAAQMSNMRARRAMEDTWRYMGERKIFGRYQREFQELRHWMADMLAHLLGMESFTYEVTKRYIEEEDPPSKVVSMVKYYSTELSHHITDRCLQIHGGMGYMDETPISRAWRDGRLSTIGGGASEVMKEVIVKEIVREAGGAEDNSLYSPEEIELKKQATRFIREKIMPRIEEWESKGEMPKSVFQEFGEQGYLGIRADEKYGGANMTETGVLALADAIETSTSAGLGAAIMMHAGIVTGVVNKLATDEVKDRILPGAVKGDLVGAMALTEPGAGSDLSSLQTTAKKDGDHYVLNGTKIFITNGCWCDFALVLCRSEEGSKGYKGMSVLLVEKGTPGFSVSRRIDTVGWKPSQTGELVFEDCRVPAGNLIGTEGRGFQQVMGFLNWERVMMAYQSVRKAELALKMTQKYVMERQQFGRPIATFQNVRQRIADMATRIEVGRSLAKEAVRRYMADDDAEAFVASAKLLCCQDAQEIIDDCLQLHGGYGYTMEFPIQRLWRDHRLFTIGGGTNEVQREILAKILDA
ncbi:MAG: acyl-CoA dehydrogenase family protein, partial [Chrysiogenetes bacterium]|nr:acyl-CoA dehydrogenase family protein [Chrysiogenetes bacterium]